MNEESKMTSEASTAMSSFNTSTCATVQMNATVELLTQERFKTSH